MFVYILGDNLSNSPIPSNITETTDVYMEQFSATLFEAKGLRHSLRDPANPQSNMGQYIEKIASWLKASP